MTKVTVEAGTPKYAAPETLDGLYGTPSDVWSLGIVMVELFSKEKAWKSILSKHQLYRKIEGGELPPEVDHTGQFQGVIRRCCCLHPKARISATELLQRL